MINEDFRSLSPNAQETLRRKAVSAVISGRSQVEAASLFGVTREAVGSWVKRYRSNGVKALKAKRRGRPPGGTLKPWQAARIAKAVIDHHPEQLKLPFYLWTREAVGQLIEDRFGIRLSRWTVGRYLERWGFTPQKPLRRAYEQDSKKVRDWLKRKYPVIRRGAKRDKACIYWGDEMGLRSDHSTGTSYGRRGHTPIIPGSGQHFRCNMVSAIANRGELFFRVFKERFVTAVFIDFLRRLVRKARHKIYLIVDRHPVHRAVKVTKWLNKHEREIRMFFLPDYSPELNPDELLNQDVKSNALGRVRPKDQKQLVAGVRSYLWSRQHQPDIVKNYFSEEHVRYAAM